MEGFEIMEGKTILIFGQSGTFGTAMTKKLLELGVAKVIGYDRSEKNQVISRQIINDPRVKRVIGDIRDKEAVDKTIRVYKPDYIFLASAMKHIDKCEAYPDECRKTNIDGCLNVINSAISNKVEKLVFLSTDKATNPSTIYGTSKLFIEQYIESVDNEDTQLIRTRYGNVLGSNGSVLQIWKDQASKGLPLTITNPDITRFFMTIDEAIDLVLYANKEGKNGDLFVYNNKACTIGELANAISDNQIVTGLRCVEKTDEALLTIAERNRADHVLIEHGRPVYFRYNKTNQYYEDYYESLTSDNAEKFTEEEIKVFVNGI